MYNQETIFVHVTSLNWGFMPPKKTTFYLRVILFFEVFLKLLHHQPISLSQLWAAPQISLWGGQCINNRKPQTKGLEYVAEIEVLQEKFLLN